MFMPAGIPQQVRQHGGVAAAGCVVSVEYVEVTMAAGSTSATVALTKGQDETKCVPFQGMTWGVMANYTSDDYAGKCLFGCEIYDNAGTPTVRFLRGLTSSQPHVLSAYIVEFNADVSVQKLSVSTTSVTTNITCSTVDQTRTFALPSIYSDSSNTAFDDANDLVGRVRFTSNTNVELYRGGSSTVSWVGWVYLVEDVADTHFTVQTVLASYSTLGNKDAAISAVDVNTTMIIATAGNSNASGSLFDHSVSYRLLDTDTVRTTLHGDGTDTRYCNIFVVEWEDGTTVQRGEYDLTTTTTTGLNNTDNTISAVDLDNAIAHITNHDVNANLALNTNHSSQVGESCARIKLTSTTNVRITRQSVAVAIQALAAWEVIEFAMAA